MQMQSLMLMSVRMLKAEGAKELLQCSLGIASIKGGTRWGKVGQHGIGWCRVGVEGV